MRLSDRVAHWIVHKPWAIWSLVCALLVGGVTAIVFWAKLNSDVLDMLPGHFESEIGRAHV